MSEKRTLLQIKVIQVTSSKNGAIPWYEDKIGETFFVFGGLDKFDLVGSKLGHRLFVSDCEVLNNFGMVDSTDEKILALNHVPSIDACAWLELWVKVEDNIKKKTEGEGLFKHVVEGDPVNHPKHLTSHPSGVEFIQIAEHLNFCLGAAMKYIWRCDLKGKPIEDLEKAAWYIAREIERRKKG